MRAFLKLSLIAGAVMLASSGFEEGVARTESVVAPAGMNVAVGFDRDAEMLRLERLFSQGSQDSGLVAPRVWSSRLEIRWTARWEAEPRFAV